MQVLLQALQDQAAVAGMITRGGQFSISGAEVESLGFPNRATSLQNLRLAGLRVAKCPIESIDRFRQAGTSSSPSLLTTRDANDFSHGAGV